MSTPLPVARAVDEPDAQPVSRRELPVSETFYSIQGEGKLAGVPSHFIRLSGCNLRCTWCDTPYASWNPEGARRTIDDLVAEVLSGTPETWRRHTVITGGEPMIFDAVEELCAALHARGVHITVETAGTVFRDLPCGLMSISPKLANSIPGVNDPRDPGGRWRRRQEERRLNIRVLQQLLDRFPTPGRQLKFVVSVPNDLPEIDDLLSHLRGWKAEDILLMPEGVTFPPPQARAWIAAECLQRNWGYCPRLHIELYGNRRGT